VDVHIGYAFNVFKFQKVFVSRRIVQTYNACCIDDSVLCVQDGATHVVVDDCLHSMSRLGTFDDEADQGVEWYGSDRVVDVWLEALQRAMQGPCSNGENPGTTTKNSAIYVSMVERQQETVP
jgi:hypothetical protein